MTTVTITDGSRLITVSPHGTNVYVGTVMDPPIFNVGLQVVTEFPESPNEGDMILKDGKVYVATE